MSTFYPSRVLARTLAMTLTESELNSIRGGDTTAPCDDSWSHVTYINPGDEKPGDCST